MRHVRMLQLKKISQFDRKLLLVEFIKQYNKLFFYYPIYALWAVLITGLGTTIPTYLSNQRIKINISRQHKIYILQ